MADVITILHPEGAPEDNLYPNVKMENLPSSVQNSGKLVYSSYKETAMTPGYSTVLDTLTITDTGTYLISAFVEGQISYSNEQNAAIKLNGDMRANQMGTGQNGGGQSVSCVVEATSGDVFSLVTYGYYPNTGLTMRSRFMVVRLR